jgi:hypothetical protein
MKMALTLLRKNNSDPISAYHDSLLWHSLLGSGVLDSAYDGFKGKASASSFSISSGLILYGGRLAEITKGTSIVLDTSELTSAVCYVYLSITISSDDSASTVSIYASSNSSLASSKTPVDGVGTFVMMLFSFNKSTGSVTEQFKRILPGIALNAVNLLGDGYINGVKFSDIFLSDMSGVKYALESDVAAEADGFVGGSKNIVQSNLYMPNRGVYLLQDAILANIEGVTLKAGETANVAFVNSASLQQGEDIVEIDYTLNGGTTVRKSGQFADDLSSNHVATSFMITGGVHILILASQKKLQLINKTKSDVSIASLRVDALCFGGAA